MKKILLLGGGGHCKSVIDSIMNSNLYEIIGIIDCEEKIGNTINTIPIIDCDKNLYKYTNKKDIKVFITVGSVGNVEIREKLYKITKELRFEIATVVDQSAIIASNVVIEEGTFVGKKAIINADSIIGKNCIINTGSIIEHDCLIGNFSHIAPGSTICGQCRIGERTHIGAGSIVIQGITIGNSVMIGAGSVVVKNIGNSRKAYGNYCRER
ncbi:MULTISPECIES: acetyltransferase [Clostridium]|uniref:acetyltransferase n=1 Tax=Clostridium TaxID=1485 RepID=UPI0012E69EFA|nr:MULTISPECIES: acetyltransferase [Clostridium]MBS4780778.1 acetyltransferase [Clostridium sp.]CAI3629304.1 Serine acetyltransferase [Clostridium neonatale]SUQ53179.1 Putative acetyltransferase EpsM [Clostridium neonatale]